MPNTNRLDLRQFSAAADDLHSFASVRALLRAWNNPAALRRHPLVRSWLVQQRSLSHNVDPTTALREVAREMVERLRPSLRDQHTDSHAWRAYRMLTGYYFDNLTLVNLASELKIAEVTARRALQRAVRTLADAWREAEHRAVAQPAPPLAVRLPVNTAPPLRGLLIGRADLLAQLQSLLGFGCRRIALHGLPGVGKTHLLIELARSSTAQALFPDGVLWAGLGPYPDVADILINWAAALGISQADLSQMSPATCAQVLRQHINDRRLLFVLNDVWHLDHIAPLLIGGPQCGVLISTRRADIAAAFADGAGIVQTPELDEAHSAQLLQQLAPQLKDTHPDELAELARLSGGLPLALTLIGHLLRREFYTGQERRMQSVLQRLRDSRQRLKLTLSPTEASLYGMERPLSLQESVGLSLAALSRDQRSALLALSVLPPKPGAFDEALAVAVLRAAAQLTQADPAAALAVLDALVDAGLVEYHQRAYQIHPAIVEVILASEDASARTIRRNAGLALVAEMIQRFQQAPCGKQPEPAWWPALLAAVEMVIALQQAESAAVLCTHLIEHLAARGRADLVERMLQTAESGIEQLDAIWRDAVVVMQSWLVLQRGNPAQAAAHLRALTQRAEPMQPVILPFAHVALTEAYLHLGDMLAALETCERGLSLPQIEENVSCHLRLLIHCAAALGNLGRYEASEQTLRDVLLRLKHSDQTVLRLKALTNLAALCRQQKRYAEAQEYLETALTLARQIDSRAQMAYALTSLGIIAVEQKEYARAEPLYREALSLARQLASFPHIVMAEHAMGVLKMRQQDWPAAYKHLTEALTLAEQRNLTTFAVSVRIELGEWHLAQGALDQAADVFAVADAVSQERKYEAFAALAQFGLAQVEAKRGNYARARQLAAASLDCLRSQSHYRADEVAEWLAALPADASPTQPGELSAS
ncbi:MAG: NB-ARC domain-containing protein [Aggregatilineales bacterium]